jgi:hypothetical protein
VGAGSGRLVLDLFREENLEVFLIKGNYLNYGIKAEGNFETPETGQKRRNA